MEPRNTTSACTSAITSAGHNLSEDYVGEVLDRWLRN